MLRRGAPAAGGTDSRRARRCGSPAPRRARRDRSTQASAPAANAPENPPSPVNVLVASQRASRPRQPTPRENRKESRRSRPRAGSQPSWRLPLAVRPRIRPASSTRPRLSTMSEVTAATSARRVKDECASQSPESGTEPGCIEQEEVGCRSARGDGRSRGGRPKARGPSASRGRHAASDPTARLESVSRGRRRRSTAPSDDGSRALASRLELVRCACRAFGRARAAIPRRSSAPSRPGPAARRCPPSRRRGTRRLRDAPPAVEHADMGDAAGVLREPEHELEVLHVVERRVEAAERRASRAGRRGDGPTNITPQKSVGDQSGFRARRPRPSARRTPGRCRPLDRGRRREPGRPRAEPSAWSSSSWSSIATNSPDASSSAAFVAAEIPCSRAPRDPDPRVPGWDPSVSSARPTCEPSSTITSSQSRYVCASTDADGGPRTIGASCRSASGSRRAVGTSGARPSGRRGRAAQARPPGRSTRPGAPAAGPFGGERHRSNSRSSFDVTSAWSRRRRPRGGFGPGRPLATALAPRFAARSWASAAGAEA